MDNISKYLTTALFASFAGKIIWYGNPTNTEALALIGLGAISFVYQYYTNNKEIKALEEKVEVLDKKYEDALELHEQKITDTLTSLASVKIGTGMTSRRLSNG